MTTFSGQTVLVTGATSGLGEAIALGSPPTGHNALPPDGISRGVRR
jgi:NADP-dependent 3-hydroxy acid dehydrogenase YdfG